MVNIYLYTRYERFWHWLQTVIIIHIYMITTGHTIFAHTRAMITGWEKVPEDTEIQDREKKERLRRPASPGAAADSA